MLHRYISQAAIYIRFPENKLKLFRTVPLMYNEFHVFCSNVDLGVFYIEVGTSRSTKIQNAVSFGNRLHKNCRNTFSRPISSFYATKNLLRNDKILKKIMVSKIYKS